MKFLQLLQEASDLPLSDLKKAIQKDKRVALVLKKDSSFSNIEDVSTFASTIKFLVLNNRNVMNFVKMREDIRDIYPGLLSNLRKIKPSDFSEENFKELKEFLSSLFKEHTYVEKKSLSRDARQEIDSFINSNGTYHNLKGWVQREIASVPGLRPDKKVMLYRGLLFSEYSLKETTRYDGTLEKGNGVKFLEAIRDGSRTVDLEWDRASSWTTSKQVAEQFAKYGPAQSSFGAQMMWFDRQIQKRAIDGALGFVISTLANPEDILIDVKAYRPTTHHAHGDEGEMILRPGKYLCRISKKFTVEGEVDPTTKVVSALPKAIDAALLKLKELSLPSISSEVDHESWMYESFNLLKQPDLFRKLLLSETTEQANTAFTSLMNVYHQTLHHLNDEDTRADAFASDPEMRKKAAVIKSVLSSFRESVKHSKFTEKGNKGKVYELTGDEFRSTILPTDLRQIERTLSTYNRISDRDEGRSFVRLASILGIEIENGNRFHQLGDAKQSPVIDDVLNKFFKLVKVSKPDDRKEAVSLMSVLIKKAYRNYKIIQKVKKIKSELENIHNV